MEPEAVLGVAAAAAAGAPPPLYVPVGLPHASHSRRLQQMREQRMLTVLHGIDGGAHRVD